MDLRHLNSLVNEFERNREIKLVNDREENIVGMGVEQISRYVKKGKVVQTWTAGRKRDKRRRRLTTTMTQTFDRATIVAGSATRAMEMMKARSATPKITAHSLSLWNWRNSIGKRILVAVKL